MTACRCSRPGRLSDDDLVFPALDGGSTSPRAFDVVTISKRLGHASPAITLKVYAHLFGKRHDKAADAINAALANLGALR